MPLNALKSLFLSSSGRLPTRIVTSAFTNQDAVKYLQEYGPRPIPGNPIQLKATRQKNGRYKIEASYSAYTPIFYQYSKRSHHVEKTNVTLFKSVTPEIMLHLLAGFEEIGRGTKLDMDRSTPPPQKLDGSIHIAHILKNPKYLRCVKPELFVAQKLRKLKKLKSHKNLRP